MKKINDLLNWFSPAQFWAIMFLLGCIAGFAVEGRLQ